MKHWRIFLLLFLAAIFLVCGILVSTIPTEKTAPASTPDADLVRSLLHENLADRQFSFATVAEAASGKKVLPLDLKNPVHERVTSAINAALTATLADLNQPSSPARQLRRINEASRLFEDGLHQHLSKTSGLTCEIPINREGEHQRSGYPDLRIVDQASKQVFYLDPKLVESGSETSTLRSFYFEPKTQTLKITDDAVHLVISILHDGKTNEWTFTKGQLVDLSNLTVRLKAEFQASNADLYKTEDAETEARK